MTVVDELISEVRELRKAVAGLEQKRSRTLMPATVKSVTGSKVTATLSDDGEDGPVETPALRMAQTTGKRGGGVSKFAKMGVGDTVLVISPDGDVTSRSAVVPWVDTEDDPAPGSAENDGEVIEVGNAKIEVNDGYIRFTIGGASWSFSSGGLETNKTVNVTDGDIINKNKSVGATHVHKDVMPGGGNTGHPA